MRDWPSRELLQPSSLSAERLNCENLPKLASFTRIKGVSWLRLMFEFLNDRLMLIFKMTHRQIQRFNLFFQQVRRYWPQMRYCYLLDQTNRINQCVHYIMDRFSQAV